MSLINQMLKDLEKRKGKASADATEGLVSSSSKSRSKSTLPYTVAVLAVLVGAVGYVLYVKDQPTEPLNLAAERAKIKHIIQKAKATRPASPVLTQFQYTQSNDTGSLVLQFNRKPHVTLSLQPKAAILSLHQDSLKADRSQEKARC